MIVYTTLHTFFNLLGRGKSHHSHINSVTSLSGIPLTDPQEIASELNHFFTSIPTPEIDKHVDTLLPSEDGEACNFVISPVTELQVSWALSKLSSSKRGGIVEIPTAVYQQLASTVVPTLTHFINKSIDSSSFPKIYKQALVTPIFKKGDPSQLGNYRPISSLPVLSKVFESLISKQVIEYIDRFKLLSDKQFGFRKGVSTEQLILSVTDHYNCVLDSKKPQYIAHLSLDVRKAFDSVHHNLLLHKLSSLFSFSNDSVSLFRSYLSSRSQCMKVGDAVSECLPISKGVPQGSVLGPLLFNIMVNDLLVSNHNVLSYADDTLLFATADTPEAALVEASNKYSVLAAWYANNGLSLCPQKTNCTIFSNRNVPPDLDVVLDGHVTKVEPAVRMLGITLDSKLSYTTHTQRFIVAEISNAVCTTQN